MNFVLRGGREHRSLTLAQLNFGYEPDPDCPDQMLEFVEYVEHGSKNRPGGRKTSVHQIQTACKATVTSKQKENDGNQANLPLECKPLIESLPPIPPSDALKTLNFQTVHGGVLNINLHINQ